MPTTSPTTTKVSQMETQIVMTIATPETTTAAKTTPDMSTTTTTTTEMSTRTTTTSTPEMSTTTTTTPEMSTTTTTTSTPELSTTTTTSTPELSTTATTITPELSTTTTTTTPTTMAPTKTTQEMITTEKTPTTTTAIKAATTVGETKKEILSIITTSTTKAAVAITTTVMKTTAATTTIPPQVEKQEEVGKQNATPSTEAGTRSTYDKKIGTLHSLVSTQTLISPSFSSTYQITPLTTTTATSPIGSVIRVTKGENIENSSKIYKNYTFVIQMTKDGQLENPIATPVLIPSKSIEMYKNDTPVVQSTKHVKIENSTNMFILKPSKSIEMHKNNTSIIRKDGKDGNVENSTVTSFSKQMKFTEIYKNYTSAVQGTKAEKIINSTNMSILKASKSTEILNNNTSVIRKTMDIMLENSTAMSFPKPSKSTEIYMNYTFVAQKTKDEKLEKSTVSSSLEPSKSADVSKNYTSVIQETNNEKLENSTAMSFVEPSTSTEIYTNYASVGQKTKDEKIENSTDMSILMASKSSEVHNNYTSVIQKTMDKTLENSTVMSFLKPSKSTDIYMNYTFVAEKTEDLKPENLTVTSLVKPSKSPELYKNYTSIIKAKDENIINSTVMSFLNPLQNSEIYKNYTSLSLQKTNDEKRQNSTAMSSLAPSKSTENSNNYTFVIRKTMDKTLENSTTTSFLNPSKSTEMYKNYTSVVQKSKDEKLVNSTAVYSLQSSKSTEIFKNYTFVAQKTKDLRLGNSTSMSILEPPILKTNEEKLANYTNVLAQKSSVSSTMYKSYISVTSKPDIEALENSTTLLRKSSISTTMHKKYSTSTALGGNSISTENATKMLIFNSSATVDPISTSASIMTKSIYKHSDNFTEVLITKPSESIYGNYTPIMESELEIKYSTVDTVTKAKRKYFNNVTEMSIPQSSVNSEIISPEITLGISVSSISISALPLKSKAETPTNMTLVLSAMQTDRVASTLILISTAKLQVEKTVYESSLLSYMPPTSSIWLSSSTVHRSFRETTETYFNINASILPHPSYPANLSSTYVPIYIKVIGNMESFMEQNITNMHAKQKSWVKDFIINTSLILNEIGRENEKHSLDENSLSLVRKKSLDFVEFLEDTTLIIGKQLPVGEKVNVTTKELVVEISAHDPLEFTGYVFAPVSSKKEHQSIQLSSNIFKNTTITQKVSVTSLFMDIIPAMRKRKGNFKDIGKVITISLDVVLDNPREKTLIYSLSAPENNYSRYKCVFWNSTDWDTEGCRVANISGTLVTCECDHLTSFSVLMQVSEFETHSTHAYVLNIISYIGCSISIAGCILLMLTFLMCGRLLKVSRNVIHMNLALAMTISNGLFICADSVHMYKAACLTVSIAMLYSYLASFFWMLVEGLHVYLMIVKVFKSPSMMKVYLIIGWLLPAVIVTVAGMKYHVNFTRDDFCWISTDGNVIWVFVGPVLFIIAVNTIILAKALSTSYKMAVAETAFLKLQETARLTMLLMPIFGLTWIFGLLAINKQLIVFQYLFTICNSLQGLYIFLCYCVLNNEVRQEFERIRRKYQYGSDKSTSSDSNFSVYNQLFTKRSKKSVVSMDASNMVKLTRYDSVKTELTTSPSSRASSMAYDSVTKRANKHPIELINLNESFSENKHMEANDSMSMSSSLCPEEHDYGLRLKYDEVPLTNGHHRVPASHFERSTDELSNGTCTYDTFKRKK